MFVDPYGNSLIFIYRAKTITEKKMFCIMFVVLILCKGRRDRMVVGFTTTYAISVYYHWFAVINSCV